ncbi:SGNH/GDSL hydrolase family protein [Lactiplantibacillus plantarum]|uniref:SGNH/GDSL hydrolase family protein n=1 Tax=Lactiplantibacillus plantarum TaxID=1590 RepID=UPI001CCE1013|nr:SGNH/GDSL hydrolase family protein [Lactiplantibacillus plantarum]
MAKTLSFTDTSAQIVKIGDTTTSFTLICGNDNVATDLTKVTSITVKLGNASGYLKSATVDPASLTDPTTGQVTVNFSPELMTSLPAGSYYIEVWVVDSTGTSIYPSDGPIGFTITNNIQSTNGSTITTITFDDFVNKFDDIVAKYQKGRDSADIYEANEFPDYNSTTKSIHFFDEYAFVSSPNPVQIVNEFGEKDFDFDITNQTGFILIDRYTGVIQTELSSGDFGANYAVIGGVRYNGRLKLNGLFTVDGTYYDDFESSPNYNIYFSDTRNGLTWDTVNKKIVFNEANVNYGRNTIRIADQTLTYSTEGTYFIYYNKSNLNFEIEQPPLNVSGSRFQVGFFNTYNLEMYLHADPKCIKITPKSQSNYDLSTNNNLTFFGDSITYGLHASDSSHSYPSIISKSANINVYNEGVSSATWQNGSGNDNISLVTRSESIDFTRGNTVVLFAGTNDFAQSLPIGTLTDTTDKTMLGAINLVIKNIYSKNPVADILLILPMWRARINDANTPADIESTTNSIGKYLKDYNEAITSAGEYYHFPVLDLYHVFGVNKLNYTQWLADGLHPNDAGYAKLANIIGNFIARS